MGDGQGGRLQEDVMGTGVFMTNRTCPFAEFEDSHEQVLLIAYL